MPTPHVDSGGAHNAHPTWLHGLKPGVCGTIGIHTSQANHNLLDHLCTPAQEVVLAETSVDTNAVARSTVIIFFRRRRPCFPQPGRAGRDGQLGPGAKVLLPDGYLSFPWESPKIILRESKALSSPPQGRSFRWPEDRRSPGRPTVQGSTSPLPEPVRALRALHRGRQFR